MGTGHRDDEPGVTWGLHESKVTTGVREEESVAKLDDHLDTLKSTDWCSY